MMARTISYCSVAGGNLQHTTDPLNRVRSVIVFAGPPGGRHMRMYLGHGGLARGQAQKL